ncbi:DUF2796 domain-containing protein [Alteromonas sediminis]|uniref:DUF2796 domain-containing protein n=1 Tax=Alteromonas sediminis TaxID=2259342 RepID=A0A3N5Y0A0_9ALTE|nr:DUF2796 domain-containing protein [Alteromonas sediminis]RPJ65876.1 DUF2796 domain-containing protein [Alteromonas sediminis]
MLSYFSTAVGWVREMFKSNTKIGKSVLAMGLLVAFNASAQNTAHVHGKGTAFVVQQDNEWQLQFTLPAADIFGFEHYPDTAEQKKRVKAQDEKLSIAESFLTLPGGCQIVSIDASNPFSSSQHGGDHDHDHDHDAHYDVEATLRMSCNQALSGLTFSLFQVFESLESIDVMWTLESGQGMQEISPARPSVDF